MPCSSKLAFSKGPQTRIPSFTFKVLSKKLNSIVTVIGKRTLPTWKRYGNDCFWFRLLYYRPPYIEYYITWSLFCIDGVIACSREIKVPTEVSISIYFKVFITVQTEDQSAVYFFMEVASQMINGCTIISARVFT